MSRLENLSHIDFEDLCRDLAKIDTGKRFSAFGPGPDGGVDGRYSESDGAVIIQCKHYSKSSFSNLKTALKDELKKIKKLNPKRYLFFTSQSLTPNKKEQLAEILDAHLQKPEDIWGLEDIEGGLRQHPEIEKSHLKLWLSSTAVLERILQSGLESFTHATKDEILEELKVYVRNPSLEQGTKKLESEKILIISGPPGVGKTSLAKMVVYNYLNDGWQFYAINSLENGFAKIDDSKRTIFFFDDFLGRIELNKQSLLKNDTPLATFVNRIRKSKNARFILTTRAHIFEEARGLSDHIDHHKFQLAKYLLDVGAYTRKIKSYILFNHLFISNLTPQHYEALLQNDWLKKIIDHKNYNPRVIVSVTSDIHDEVEATNYPKYILQALENPNQIWSKPYHNLNITSQNLLIALFFGNEYGEKIDVLRKNYSELHRMICKFYSQPTKPNDFENALHSLESGFISISGQNVSFVNPSLRDFLKANLTNKELLALLPVSSQRADWAKKLWAHIKNSFNSDKKMLKETAQSFKRFSGIIEKTPAMRSYKRDGNTYYTHNDLSLSGRIEILLEWWECSKDDFFIEKALKILKSPSSIEYVSWSDNSSLPQLYSYVDDTVDNGHKLKFDILLAIEKNIIYFLTNGLSIDELITTIQAVTEYMNKSESIDLQNAIDEMVEYEFNITSSDIYHLDTPDCLEEHLQHLDELAKLTGYDSDAAKMTVTDRIVELEEQDYSFQPQQTIPYPLEEDENFTDVALISLFSTLKE